MKAILSIVLLLVVLQGVSQRKKKADPRDEKIDSLTATNALLAVQVDSLAKEQKVYSGMYTTIKEKVLLKDFDPAKLPQIIDSIRLSRDSLTSAMGAPVSGLRDSLAIVNKENLMLKTKIDSMTVTMNALNASAGDKTKLMAELKDLKSLLDAKIISPDEYEAKKKIVMSKWQ